jgi:hypothetical protein
VPLQELQRHAAAVSKCAAARGASDIAIDGMPSNSLLRRDGAE